MQNGMTEEQVERYDKLPFIHKIIFVSHKMDDI